jgi:hypothetical protein
VLLYDGIYTCVRGGLGTVNIKGCYVLNIGEQNFTFNSVRTEKRKYHLAQHDYPPKQNLQFLTAVMTWKLETLNLHLIKSTSQIYSCHTI